MSFKPNSNATFLSFGLSVEDLPFNFFPCQDFPSLVPIHVLPSQQPEGKDSNTFHKFKTFCMTHFAHYFSPIGTQMEIKLTEASTLPYSTKKTFLVERLVVVVVLHMSPLLAT